MAMNPRLLRPLASGFNPRSIAGLGLWLDASNTASLTFNGTDVSEWRDLSGNARHFSQDTAASQPDGAGRTQNGLRVLDFDGTKSLEGNAASQSIFRNVGGATMCGVFKRDSVVSGTNNSILFSAYIAAATFQARAALTINNTGGFRVASRRNDADSVAFITIGPPSNNAVVMAGVIDYANSDALLTLNGGTPATDTNFLTDGNTSDTDGEVLIGRSPNNSDALDGFVAEVLAWPRVLTTAERQRVEGYLAWKWGLQAQLPYDHPYARSFPGFGSQTLPTDPDAQTYLAAVAAADGTGVEVGVANAVDDFVKGCKSDGIWDAIKASCILSGARTLAGALTPLAGTAPTNNGPFVSGDYNRKTGLVGNGSTKFLNSGRANNADGQNDKHVAVWLTSQHNPTNVFACQAGAGSNGAGAINLATTGRPQIRFHTSTLSDPISNTALQDGLYAASREASGSYTSRQNGSNATISVASETPTSDNLFIFCRNNGSGTGEQFTNARIAFYSIGTSLTLSSLDSRVGALVTAIGAAI